MAKEHEMATSVVDQTKEDQTHSSMMAWRVHVLGGEEPHAGAAHLPRCRRRPAG